MESESKVPEGVVSLEAESTVWDRVFVVSPLVVVGTREGTGWNLAPKHLAMPLSWEDDYGFVCTPRHATYHNAKEHGAFTVSYLRSSQVVVSSLTASPRCGSDGEQPILDALPTWSARSVEGILLRDAYLFLECEVARIIDGFGDNSLIVGKVVATHADRDALRGADREDAEAVAGASPLVYLNPGRYAKLKQSHAFPFPSGFRK
jgi:flavin reductase (DIM6/NTAB) family NADH-FMN oxidoreductase RutF